MPEDKKKKALQWAPFTEEQIQSLVWRQEDKKPYTCSCGKVLVPTVEGLVCECGTVQKWVCPSALEYQESPVEHSDTFKHLTFLMMLGKMWEDSHKPYIVPIFNLEEEEFLKQTDPKTYAFYHEVLKKGSVVHNGREYILETKLNIETPVET